MDRTQVALAILPTMIGSINTPGQVSEENRRRVIDSAFGWADDFLAARDEHSSAGLDEALSNPIIG